MLKTIMKISPKPDQKKRKKNQVKKGGILVYETNPRKFDRNDFTNPLYIAPND